MTTVAFDGVSLCADSLVTMGTFRAGRANKIHKLADGRLFVASGHLDQIHAVKQWLDGGDKPEETDDFDGYIVDNGKPYCVGNNLCIYEAWTPFVAGSGMEIAMTAMMCGKTAREAVEIACSLDANSGLPVQEVMMEGTGGA